MKRLIVAYPAQHQNPRTFWGFLRSLTRVLTDLLTALLTPILTGLLTTVLTSN
jgi:hypothetical protein